MNSYFLGRSVIILAVLISLFLPSPVTSFSKKNGKRQAGGKKQNPAGRSDRPDPKTIPGLKFIGWVGNEALYIGLEKMARTPGWKFCKKSMDKVGYDGHLISVVDSTKQGVYDVLKNIKEINHFWVAHWIESKDGKEFMIKVTPDGRTVREDVTGRGLLSDVGRKKRGVLTTYANQAMSPRGKRDGDDGGSGTKLNQITVKEIHYPWIANWGQGEGKECSIQQCKPRTCKITTPECVINKKECQMEKPKCNLVHTSPCSVVCEDCTIKQPECYVGNTECGLDEERHCTVVPPECTVVTPPCTVVRPPCVTQYPPCFVEETTETCEVHTSCPEEQLGAKGMNCTVQPRDCTEEEIKAGRTRCEFKQCDPQLLCLKPTVCKQPTIRCPYPKTFCPPESVHCPQPYVNCTEPIFTCTPPKFTCPYPKVVCEEPQVNCTAPRTTCPPTITECGHPVVTCPPPEVTCPEPVVECDPPVPCPFNPDIKICITEEPCNDSNLSCTCVAIKRRSSNSNGEDFDEKGAICDQFLTPLCATTILS